MNSAVIVGGPLIEPPTMAAPGRHVLDCGMRLASLFAIDPVDRFCRSYAVGEPVPNHRTRDAAAA